MQINMMKLIGNFFFIIIISAIYFLKKLNKKINTWIGSSNLDLYVVIRKKYYWLLN